ncbi:NADH:flavorubredoxin reductase NorW [Yersinia aleksiciae]|uniref:NADH:flavorubredoxin reductase NorW n=1 Tax=Yersinia aleksiciae TaxID=263819 RepID=UPI0011A7C3D4|nr:NADH:flavorubredoxin reductase NorW [Yersinia aleksiciae]MDN0124320.1 NADH:flavorubredoxin reductase NorW [Yersinia aleksiciae]
MQNNLVIIGSGFAARQLVKNIRRADKKVAITLFAADSADEYNKPDLSHVFSLNQSADDLTQQTAKQFAQENNLIVYANTEVTAIDRQARQVICGEQCFNYQKLVLATGAKAMVPSIQGSDLLATFNSQSEYRQHQETLQVSQHIVVLGAGLIGCELAMDLRRAGKQVTLVDRSHCLLSALMPAELSSRLQNKFSLMGIQLALNNEISRVERVNTGLKVTFRNGLIVEADAVVSSMGLKPEISLAKASGLQTARGIQVNDQLQTSDKNIYALGDCAEMAGKVQSFLQPILLGAMTLAKNLLGNEESLRLPAMLLKIKTPDLPLVMAGEALRQDLNWEITLCNKGMMAQGTDARQQLRAFVVSEEYTQQAFTLLRNIII